MKYEFIDYTLRWDNINFQFYRYPLIKDGKFFIISAREIVGFSDLKKYPHTSINQHLFLKHNQDRIDLKKKKLKEIYLKRMACDFEWSFNYRSIRLITKNVCCVCNQEILNHQSPDFKKKYPIYLMQTKGTKIVCEECSNDLPSNLTIYGNKPIRDNQEKPMSKYELERLRIDEALQKHGFKPRKRYT